jgi:hypothetical protein
LIGTGAALGVVSPPLIFHGKISSYEIFEVPAPVLILPYLIFFLQILSAGFWIQKLPVFI